MPPKKGKGGGKKGKDPGITPEEIDAFVKAYKKFCAEAGLPVYEPLLKQVADEGRDEFVGTQQLILHPVDPQDPAEPRLGPGGTRALCTALLGTAPGMGAPFKAVKAVRCWHSRIGDDGAASWADVLRLGGAEVQLSYMELWDNGIGARGCRALGVALMLGGNKSLQTLRLDYNGHVGAEGVANLCRGLRSNATLKQLHLPYCGVGPAAGRSLGDALAFAQSGLAVLNLEGNHLGDEGLGLLCPGLAQNASLGEVNLDDNGIGANPRDVSSMAALAAVLSKHASLTVLTLNYNKLCPESAAALLPGLVDPTDPTKKHPRLKKVVVDAGLEGIPPEMYEKLYVEGGGGGKKGKKGKKKK